MQASSAQIGAEGENLFDALQTPDLPFNRDAYIHQRLAEVVCHEMGHCLGLRHNFVASTQLSLQQLSNPAYVLAHGTSASVMDYVPYNVGAIKHKGVDYYQTTVGDYDTWAISYGYTLTPAVTPEGDKTWLSPIASESGQPSHRYLSDYTADDYDPADVRYDFSSDPLAWSARLMEISHYLLTTASSRRIQNGESFYGFSRSWVSDLNTYLRAASYIPRYVGGVNLNNGYKDASGTVPIKPLDAASQRKALSLLDKYVFGEDAFGFRKQDLDMLTFNPNIRSNEAPSQARSFPMKSSIAAFQGATLNQVFLPAVLTRISNNEFRSSDTLGLAELFDSVDHAVWSELGSGHEISPLRRELQLDDLNLLIGFVVNRNPAVPNDAHALALTHLKSLQTRIAAAKPSAKGPYGVPHLTECLAKINQALSAQILAG
jgi:hypothetical protein